MTTLGQGRDPLVFQIGRIAEEIESAHFRNANPREPRAPPSPATSFVDYRPPPHHAATQQASSLEEGQERIAQELASLRVAHRQSSTAHRQSSTTQLEMCLLHMRATTHRRDFPLFRLRHAEEVERAAQFQNVPSTFGLPEDHPGSILDVEDFRDPRPNQLPTGTNTRGQPIPRYFTLHEADINLEGDYLISDLISDYTIPPRPASKSALDALPLVKVDADSKDELQCAICIDTMEAGSQATQLPCQHLFHRDCITHWLSNRRNTCPLCRHELQAQE